MGGGGGDVAVRLSKNTGDRSILPHKTTFIFLAPQPSGAWAASPDRTPGVSGELEVKVTTASVKQPLPLFSAHATYPAGIQTQTKQTCGVQQEKEQDGHFVLLGVGNGGNDEVFPKGFAGERHRGCASLLCACRTTLCVHACEHSVLVRVNILCSCPSVLVPVCVRARLRSCPSAFMPALD